MSFLSRNVKKLPNCTNVESNSLHRRKDAIPVTCVRQHRCLFPRCLSSHTSCTSGSMGRKYQQYTFTVDIKCPTQCGSGMMQGHRKAVCVGKQQLHKPPIFKMHHTAFPGSHFIISIINHCQYKHKPKKHLSMHSMIKKLAL